MRTAFINKLSVLARTNKDIYLLTADMGFSVFEEFAKEFDERFINVGISEANMIGIAAGLTMRGKIVFAYSIIPFLVMRCFEQIRVDACYQNLNINLVGVGGGLSYGAYGTTHHAIEDIAIMRALPNMKVICPGDPFETEQAVEQVVNISGPCYIRLNKNNEPRLYNKNLPFKIGVATKLREGKDISIIVTGNMLKEAIEVTEKLVSDGFDVKLISMHTVKPIDEKIIIECLQETQAIFSLEEHNVIGGLGSAVSEVIAKNLVKRSLYFKAYGIPDVYAAVSGKQEYLRQIYGIDSKSLVNDIKTILKHNV
jgi:transketolase